MNKKLLLIGKPHTSKTVFIAQLYSRLQKGKSKLSLYKTVEDLTSIIEARKALARGEEPAPTPAENKVQLTLPIEYNNQKIDILCPDYGGEQISEIIYSREVDKYWANAIESSDNWIFFIRPNSINKSLDISDITFTKEHEQIQVEEDYKYTISEQSSLIELFQILLHFKGHDYHFKMSKVKLTLVMTCWDELVTKDKPVDVLREHLPLLLSFLKTNWERESLKILGLAALGFPLNSEENKEKYEIEGPENFGFLIRENGQETKDITELVLETIS